MGKTGVGLGLYLDRVKVLSKLCGGGDGTDVEGGIFPGKVAPDSAIKIVCKRGVIRLLLVGVILWVVLILLATLFHVWSCHSSISILSGTYALKLFSVLV